MEIKLQKSITCSPKKSGFIKMTTCINCGNRLGCYRRKYCSNYCQIAYYNKKYSPVLRVDKWGREYIDCHKCGKRLRKLEFMGRTKFICIQCHKAGTHTPLENSTFIRRTFKKNRKTKEMLLEITQKNRNWHYLNGRPVQGFKKAINSFRATCHTLVHRRDYTEISLTSNQ